MTSEERIRELRVALSDMIGLAQCAIESDQEDDIKTSDRKRIDHASIVLMREDACPE